MAQSKDLLAKYYNGPAKSDRKMGYAKRGF